MTNDQLSLLIAALWADRRGKDTQQPGVAAELLEEARAFVAHGIAALPAIQQREAAAAEAVAELKP